MSQTLVVAAPDGRDICLPRANSLVTTSAQLQRLDRMRIADMEFAVVDILHTLYDRPKAPTTFVRIEPTNRKLTEDDVMILKGFGFEDLKSE